MAYRPQHCTLVVQNTDGSGYLRQFETLAEAKVAYASISASGAAVSLYQPATRSLALFENGGDAPEYDNGMTYGTGAVVKLNGRLYRLINFVGAGGYGPISHPYLWEDGRVPATGGPPPISSTGLQVIENGVERNPFNFTQTENATQVRMTKIGCQISQEREADGNLQSVGIYPIYRFTLPDGTIVDEHTGEKDTNGCHYPAGFKVKYSDGKQDDIYREIKVIKSLDYGGNMYGPYFQVEVFLGYSRWYDVSNGAGGTSPEESIGVPTSSTSSGSIAGVTWEYQQDGDVPYRFTLDSVNNWRNWEKLGHPIPNGNYLVTYKVTGDEKIHSGYWSVSLQNRKSKWVFTPEKPDQPPPAPCTITKKVTNPMTGIVEDQCDPDVVYPYTVTDNCEPPATVTINGTEIVVGTNIKNGMNNGYGDVVWGACSGMIYKPNGMHIFDDLDYNYYSNGIGGFYSELKNPSQCPSSGSRISREVISDYTVTIGGSIYTVGYQYEDTIADGNCGSGIEVSSEYSPNGTLIVQYEGNNYFSNGAGDYYSEPIPVIGYEGAEEFLTNEFFSAVYRTRVRPQYQGGSVGEWSQWNYIVYGTLFGSDVNNNYYSDGAGGYYSEPKAQCDDPELHTGEIGWSYDGCHWSYSVPPQGTIVSSGSGNYEVDVGCGMMHLGSYTYDNIADGVGGTQEFNSGNYWENAGTLLQTCNGIKYYADGNGSYTTCEDETTHLGEAGWSYADCHWTYTEPCPSYGVQLSTNGGSYDVNVGCGNWSSGTYGTTTYADGNCGSYTLGGSNYVSSGTLLGNCDDYNYYANGNGGYYQGEFTGNACSSSGTWIEGSGSDITFNGECATWTIGQSTYNVYADGNCGTYSESGNNYLSIGTFIGSCGVNNYYSDGAGSAYSYVAAGTSSGNSYNGMNYVYINETQYENGTFSSMEYHDGSGGFYTSVSNSYQSYGYTFTSTSSYDSETMMETWTYYNSDGNGGYYTS